MTSLAHQRWMDFLGASQDDKLRGAWECGGRGRGAGLAIEKDAAVEGAPFVAAGGSQAIGGRLDEGVAALVVDLVGAGAVEARAQRVGEVAQGLVAQQGILRDGGEIPRNQLFELRGALAVVF